MQRIFVQNLIGSRITSKDLRDNFTVSSGGSPQILQEKAPIILLNSLGILPVTVLDISSEIQELFKNFLHEFFNKFYHPFFQLLL